MMNLYKIFIFSLLLISCGTEQNEKVQLMTNESIHKSLLSLQNKKIFFGHQSVGVNIIDGLKDVSALYNDVHLNLIAIEGAGPDSNGFFADSKIGQNTDPASKCEAFRNNIEKKFSGKLDIALMKFCYVDIKAETNVDSVFSNYQSTIESLKSKYPHITFVHSTIPLTSKPGGIKQVIKSLLGYKSGNDQDNINRTRFNRMLTDKFKNEPIFDLAAVESTYPDGKRESSEREGRIYYSMIKEYTDDGGHLNRKGRSLAATALIKTLSGTAKTE